MRTASPLQLVMLRALIHSGRARQIRRDARLKQVELARALRVSPATVCSWEMGRRVPGGRNAARYLRLLKQLEAEVGQR